MDYEEEEQQIEDPEEQKKAIAEIEAIGQKIDEDVDEDEDQNDDGELRRTVTRKTVYKIDEVSDEFLHFSDSKMREFASILRALRCSLLR